MQRPAADLLRLAACVAVVAIHGGGDAAAAWRPGAGAGAGATAAAVIDQLARFCVPLFIALSGYALMARRALRPDEPVTAFWAARLRRSLPPLLCFGLIGLAWQIRADPGRWREALAAAPAALPLGATDYHLYFLPAITGCWLLFPLLARLGPGRLLAPLAVWHVLLCQPLQLLHPALVDLQVGIGQASPLRWLPWFVFGMWAAGLPPPAPSAARRRGAAILAAACGAWVAVEEMAAQAAGAEAAWVNHFARISVTAYALVVWWAWRGHADRLAAAAASPAVAAWAGRTFAIYLIHPSLLRICPVEQPQARVVLALAAAALIAAALDRWLPWGRAAVGLEPGAWAGPQPRSRRQAA